ncbi:methyltransferase-like protein 4, partial [Copidosoma floridanum]|uniref:methyltransferase-like protein 4 n=1 Tax=Copidosoma floridanum TaxID=29053 RepID=UPI0006C95F44
MSILFSSEDGWILSHLDYMHKIYENVQYEDSYETLKFKDNFFKINSQFSRQNQIENGNTDKEVKPRKKKRKLNVLPEDVLQQKNFVKEMSEKILKDIKNQKLFVNIITDDNRQSRLESRNFYIERSDLNSNYHGMNEKDVAIIAEFRSEKYVFPNNCEFYCYDIKHIREKLNMARKYDFIVLDPPWWNKSIRRKKAQFRESSYNMMYNEELMEIPIGDLLSTNGIVAVWCTNSASQIKSVLEDIFPAWNVIFRAKWYWLKVTQSGKPVCNYNESHGKQPYEQLIIGSTATVNVNVPDKKVIISVPSAIHSHKPPLIELFKSYLPEHPQCLEIFARYLLPGWISWGLEVLKFQHLSLYNFTKVSHVDKGPGSKGNI